MAQSIRVLYRGVHGRVRKNFNWHPIGIDSAVIITAAEFRVSPPVPPEQVGFGVVLPKTPGRPHLGEANVWISNVGAHAPEGGNGGVEFHLHVDWPHPIDVIVTITVLESIAECVVA